jgi:hypothetical protein
VAERDVVRALPPAYLLMLFGVVASGIVAAALTGGAILAVGWPLAIVLLILGALSVRRPVITAEPRDTSLSDGCRSRVVATFAALPQGPARQLLADVVRRGQAVRGALAVQPDESPAAATVEELIDAACASARDLAALDTSLAQFDRERDRDTGDSRWRDSVAECERTRDGAVQRLLDAVTVLGQLDLQAIRGTGEASTRLGELVTEISAEVRVRAAAREEMEALLAR